MLARFQRCQILAPRTAVQCPLQPEPAGDGETVNRAVLSLIGTRASADLLTYGTAGFVALDAC